jgi:paraquat-inducible protein B
MSEDNAGQGTTPTGEGDAGQLEAKLAEANRTIERLRGTQSANDRALADLRDSEKSLKTQLETISKERQDLESSFQAISEERDSLNEKVSELSGFQTEAESAKMRADMMRLAAVKAGENPAISILVKSGALPQADNLEDFEASLDEISENLGGIVSNQARQQLSGARPKNVTKVENTPESLEEESLRLLQAGNYDEGIKMHTQALELRMANKS